MKTTGMNDTGEITKHGLSGISTDKLIKLRDVARDHLEETFREYMAARNYNVEIHEELKARGVVSEDNKEQ